MSEITNYIRQRDNTYGRVEKLDKGKLATKKHAFFQTEKRVRQMLMERNLEKTWIKWRVGKYNRQRFRVGKKSEVLSRIKVSGNLMKQFTEERKILFRGN